MSRDALVTTGFLGPVRACFWGLAAGLAFRGPFGWKGARAGDDALSAATSSSSARRSNGTSPKA